MDAAVQILDPAARLVLAARPARARLVPRCALGARGRLPQPIQRPEQRLGDFVGADRRCQLPGPCPVARAQLVLHGVSDHREQDRVQPEAGLDQLPRLVGPARSLRRPCPQQHLDGRMPATLQRHDAACPRVLVRRSWHGGGLHRFRHQVDHHRLGQPGNQSDGRPGRKRRDALQRLPGIVRIQSPARAELAVCEQPPGNASSRGEPPQPLSRHRRAAPRRAHEKPLCPAAPLPRSPQEHNAWRCHLRFRQPRLSRTSSGSAQLARSLRHAGRARP